MEDISIFFKAVILKYASIYYNRKQSVIRGIMQSKVHLIEFPGVHLMSLRTKHESVHSR